MIIVHHTTFFPFLPNQFGLPIYILLQSLFLLFKILISYFIFAVKKIRHDPLKCCYVAIVFINSFFTYSRHGEYDFRFLFAGELASFYPVQYNKELKLSVWGNFTVCMCAVVMRLDSGYNVLLADRPTISRNWPVSKHCQSSRVYVWLTFYKLSEISSLTAYCELAGKKIAQILRDYIYSLSNALKMIVAFKH